jgi:hypothetical protein
MQLLGKNMQEGQRALNGLSPEHRGQPRARHACGDVRVKGAYYNRFNSLPQDR